MDAGQIADFRHDAVYRPSCGRDDFNSQVRTSEQGFLITPRQALLAVQQSTVQVKCNYSYGFHIKCSSFNIRSPSLSYLDENIPVKRLKKEGFSALSAASSIRSSALTLVRGIPSSSMISMRS